MKKVLVLEGFGYDMDSISLKSDIGNCMCRGYFTNDKGIIWYLEIEGKHDDVLYIKRCHKVTNLTCRSPLEGKTLYKYKKKYLVDWVNIVLDCSFNDVKVSNYGEYESYGNYGMLLSDTIDHTIIKECTVSKLVRDRLVSHTGFDWNTWIELQKNMDNVFTQNKIRTLDILKNFQSQKEQLDIMGYTFDYILGETGLSFYESLGVKLTNSWDDAKSKPIFKSKEQLRAALCSYLKIRYSTYIEDYVDTLATVSQGVVCV